MPRLAACKTVSLKVGVFSLSDSKTLFEVMVISAAVSTAAINGVSLYSKLSLKRDELSNYMVVNNLSVTIGNCSPFIEMFHGISYG